MNDGAEAALAAWEVHMAHALELARRGLGRTAPNPAVGAVLLDADGQVIGVGTTEAAGGAHAEVVALRDAVQRGHTARGGTLVVTLEPCCHHGRTPPCTDAIVAAGVRRVIVGVTDPYVAVQGRGVTNLRAAGLEVLVGCCAIACGRQVLGFARAQVAGLPEVSCKAAISLDGHIATASGDSQWITGEQARAHGRRLRGTHDAIAVGIGTVLADDPQLTVRDGSGSDPVPVVFDSRLRLPKTSRVLHGPRRAVVLTTADPDGHDLPADVVQCPAALDGRVDLVSALRVLVQRGLHRVLVEGGGVLHGALLAEGLVDSVHLYQAGVVLPGGRPWIDGVAIEPLAAARRLTLSGVEAIGGDVCTTWHAAHAVAPDPLGLHRAPAFGGR